MGDRFKQLNDSHIKFIGNQSMFFVGTAASEGLINVSPKGMDTFRVISPSRVIWLNLTGSGNETAAHVLDSNRMTIMFCSFGIRPMILRLYGEAAVLHRRDDRWQEMLQRFPPLPGTRQVFELDIKLVQTSCGFGVPRYDLKEPRETLIKWANDRGDEGIAEYWQKKNQFSLDNKPTRILDAD